MNDSTVLLQYDGDGNRVAKTVGGVTTRYLVDDLNPTGYAQVVEEAVNGAVQREYSYGLQRISENQIVNSTWTPSFYGYDGGGSVRQLTNPSGGVTDKYDYDAFGNVLNKTGSMPNEFLYRGEQFDSDLGLYYLRARYMNPVTGRFLSRDPGAGVVLYPRTLHKYLYVGGDPVNGLDPTGRAEVGPQAGGSLGEYVGLATLALGITLYAEAQHPCGVQALSNAIANTYIKVASYVDCINQYLRDLGLCYEAYKNDPAALENCYAAAKKKRDFCLGDIPGPVQ